MECSAGLRHIAVGCIYMGAICKNSLRGLHDGGVEIAEEEGHMVFELIKISQNSVFYLPLCF